MIRQRHGMAIPATAMVIALVIAACTSPAVETPATSPTAEPQPAAAQQASPAPTTPSTTPPLAARPVYVGSGACQSCHAKAFQDWRNTIHAYMVRPIARGDLMNARADLTKPGAPKADQYDWVYAIGGWYKEERYAFRNEKGDVVTGEFEYNKPKAQFVVRKDSKGELERLDWINACGGCHATGVDAQKRTFAELNIGCEACHGPGSEHAKAPKVAKVVIDTSAEACGQCHIRGKDKTGTYGWPAGYHVGEPKSLLANFDPIPVTDTASMFPDQKNSNRHRQQYLDWSRSAHATGKVACTDCHLPHKGSLSQRNADLKAQGAALCGECHKKAVADPVKHSGHTLEKATCASCHMPKLIGSGSVSTHTWEAIAPAKTIKYGDKMANSCTSTCHKDKTVQWADEQYKRIFGQ